MVSANILLYFAPVWPYDDLFTFINSRAGGGGGDPSLGSQRPRGLLYSYSKQENVTVLFII